jgi:hypothetical protein
MRMYFPIVPEYTIMSGDRGTVMFGVGLVQACEYWGRGLD